ncbi:TDT family transporter [Nocardioides zeae]|uniref:TDT family transporter n=1 Tax=Nocardioides zeae TaxID=1457234 RepID=A0A6P0HKD8_9ACTN|nr:TDT family transporter [Nocardioides zeae]NEN79083.1 TDT family transporter [Nocardioides zeae]
MTTLSAERDPRAGIPRTGFLRDLGGAPALGHIGPNWFAPVMGTGIVAVALASLPFDLPGAVPTALAFWLLAAIALLAVAAATLGHWLRHPATARGHLADPVMAHFYGAPAMALMTVGAATLLVGHRVLGPGPALAVDAVLWTAGTALGLVTAVLVPCAAFTRHDVGVDAASGAWLMPVVPPMVSAATGALLVPHLPAGQAQQTLLAVAAMFVGVSLLASATTIVLIWHRLLRHGVGAAAAVPTLWIVLGPLGQSITATHHLGRLAPDVVGGPTGRVLEVASLLYGLPVLGFALLWLALASALTLRTARVGMPFGLAWWSFTFPVGTLVTGVAGLADVTHLVALQVLAGLLLVLLLGAWATVAARTLRGIHRGTLLVAPR